MKKSTISTLFLIFLIIVWIVLLRPVTLGGSVFYVIINGKSMEPTMHTGGLAVTWSQSDYKVGDIVAFHVEGGIVIHRILAETPDGKFMTRGDGNTWDDPWTVSPQDIIGSRWLYIPGGGQFLMNILGSFRQPLYLGLYALCLTTILVIGGEMWRKPRRTRMDIIKQRRKYFQSSDWRA